MKPISIYIHIPFCVKKCLYCDFLSAPAEEELQRKYVKALCREIACESKNYVNHIVPTVFIGGGTPSAVLAEWIEEILQTVKSEFRLAQECEISMEVNPGTASLSKLEVWKRAGINRLSIGLQSAVDKELKALGRIHDSSDFFHTYEQAVKTGFNNINVDLMSAIPEQTLGSWETSLVRVAGMQPAHISAYSLIVEKGTPFYENTPPLPDEDSEREMYKITNDILSGYGYERYEISNYAKPGYACRHNQVYWQRGEYVGFGIGAASLVNHIRFSNAGDIESYVNNGAVKENICRLTQEEQMEESMFLGLRMMKGVSEREFAAQYGKSVDEVYPGIVDKFVEQGLMKRALDRAGTDTRLMLTERGVDVSNQVMAEFLLT